MTDRAADRIAAFEFIHQRCSQPAFNLTEMPKGSDNVGNTEILIHLNGDPMLPSDPRQCESCNMLMGTLEILLEHIRPIQ